MVPTKMGAVEESDGPGRKQASDGGCKNGAHVLSVLWIWLERMGKLDTASPKIDPCATGVPVTKTGAVVGGVSH